MKIFVIAEREQPVVELCAGARQFADEVDLIALPTTSVAPGVPIRSIAWRCLKDA